MDVKDAIQKRRSVRRFKEGEVSNNLINELVEAARLAPSGSNTQPTRIFVVKLKAVRERLHKEGAFDQAFVRQAPLILVICGDPKDYGGEDTPGLRGRGEDRCARDLAIASSFIVLRATELGLSSCWVGLIHPGPIRKVLGIPDRYMIPYVICIGYPAEDPGPRIRKSRDEIILGET
jgi:nitroreductase